MGRKNLKSLVDMGEYDLLPKLSEREAWISNYINERVEKPTAKSKKYLLTVVGHAGSGKSTIMKPLSEMLDLAYIRSDDIRWKLIGDGYSPKSTKGVGFEIMESLLEEGFGVALDADAIANHETLENLKKELEIPIITIHVDTDEKIILERLSNESGDRRFVGPEALEFYKGRQNLYKDNLHKFNFLYTFDGNGNLDSQLKEAVGVIKDFIK